LALSDGAWTLRFAVARGEVVEAVGRLVTGWADGVVRVVGGAVAAARAIVRDRQARGLSTPHGPRTATRANPGRLTARELEVLRLLAEGLSNAELAARLFLSERTVAHHVSAVLQKLGEPSRARAVATARRQGILAATVE
jgi:DNA-binding NarL/FixJ family response regulator